MQVSCFFISTNVCFFRIFVLIRRWIHVEIDPHLQLREPERFLGRELAVVDAAPNLIRTTLASMGIEDEKVQDEVIEEMRKLVSVGISIG